MQRGNFSNLAQRGGSESAVVKPDETLRGSGRFQPWVRTGITWLQVGSQAGRLRRVPRKPEIPNLKSEI